jgi:hypothetical protein
LTGLLGSGERAFGVADRKERLCDFYKRARLAVPEFRRDLPGCDELILQSAGSVENVFNQLGGNACRIAKSMGQVEDEAVGGLGRGGEGILGALALLLGNLPLLDGYAALPVSDACQDQRNNKSGRKAAGEDVAPPCRAAPALGDEGLRLFGRRRRVGWARGDPAFGVFERRRAQLEPAGTSARRPLPGGFAIVGVLPDPANVGLQGCGKPVDARIELRWIIEENEIQLSQWLGRCAVLNPPAHDRRKAFVQ